MLDDFFTRALVAGVGVTLVTGPLGCFVVWRRLSYFGETLAHSALLGVALAFLLEIDITLAVFAVSVIVSLALLCLQRSGTLPSDALLGLLSHSALAIGIVALAFMTWVRMDLLSFLFGDILAVSRLDIVFIYVGGGVIFALLLRIWHPLFASTLNKEIAEAENMHPERIDLIFVLLLAAVIAISMKITGVLLIMALLIIPAATARNFANTPEQMAVLAFFAGALSVLMGLMASLEWDTPSGPSVVVACFLLFIVAFFMAKVRSLFR